MANGHKRICTGAYDTNKDRYLTQIPLSIQHQPILKNAKLISGPSFNLY